MTSANRNTDREDDWGGYRQLVLHELKRINESVDKLAEDISALKVEVAVLQLKSSAWGALAGAVVAIGVILIKVAGGI